MFVHLHASAHSGMEGSLNTVIFTVSERLSNAPWRAGNYSPPQGLWTYALWLWYISYSTSRSMFFLHLQDLR